MSKKGNFKNPKPVETAAKPIVQQPKQASSSKPQKPSNEIDDIFAGKKRKKPENQEKSGVKEPKKLKKIKNLSSRIQNDDVLSAPSRRPRKKTADGLTIYTEEELGIGKNNAGGGTPLCPFDCDCCF